MFPYFRFKTLSLSCRVSFCLVVVCLEVFKVCCRFFHFELVHILYVWYSLLLPHDCMLRYKHYSDYVRAVVQSRSALCLSCEQPEEFDANNSRPFGECLQLHNVSHYVREEWAIGYLFTVDRAVIHINFIRYRLRIGRKAFNSLMLKQYKSSLQLYVGPFPLSLTPS